VASVEVLWHANWGIGEVRRYIIATLVVMGSVEGAFLL
jgi:hypothetical protein